MVSDKRGGLHPNHLDHILVEYGPDHAFLAFLVSGGVGRALQNRSNLALEDLGVDSRNVLCRDLVWLSD